MTEDNGLQKPYNSRMGLLCVSTLVSLLHQSAMTAQALIGQPLETIMSHMRAVPVTVPTTNSLVPLMLEGTVPACSTHHQGEHSPPTANDKTSEGRHKY